MDKIQKTKTEWRQQLTPEQYAVTREHGTERAFTGKFYQHKETGSYHCVCCGNPLFSSRTKYESGSGWPSFWEPVSDAALTFKHDYSHGMHRVEVLCARCDAHLGHVFPDGPQPTGQRYCINSIALEFEPATVAASLGSEAPNLS